MYQIKCHFFQFSYKGQCIGLNFGGRTLHLSRNSALIAWSSSTSHLLRYKAMFSKTFESLRFSCCPQAYPVARVSRFCWQRNPAHGPPSQSCRPCPLRVWIGKARLALLLMRTTEGHWANNQPPTIACFRHNRPGRKDRKRLQSTKKPQGMHTLRLFMF